MLEFDSIITNGYVAPDTIEWFITRGWTFVCTIPARSAHPHAMDTDKLTLFSRYTEPCIGDDEIKTGCEPI